MNEKIAAIQKLLGVAVDGVWGPKSQAALERAKSLFDVPDHLNPQLADQNDSTGSGGTQETPVDSRSEANIATLHPQIQGSARALVRICKKYGMTFKITSGSRTFEEQAELRRKYEAGGPKAARPGFSNHNFGLAMDLTEFGVNGMPIWDSVNYLKMGQIAEQLGFFWGGRWKGKDEDQPHVECRPQWALDMDEGTMIAELRRRKDNGIDVFA